MTLMWSGSKTNPRSMIPSSAWAPKLVSPLVAVLEPLRVAFVVWPVYRGENGQRGQEYLEAVAEDLVLRDWGA